MIVNFAGQTLFIWNITVTSKFDSIFNHPESDHQVSNMPVWVFVKSIICFIWYICIVVLVCPI